jgi:hypothetical protein
MKYIIYTLIVLSINSYGIESEHVVSTGSGSRISRCMDAINGRFEKVDLDNELYSSVYTNHVSPSFLWKNGGDILEIKVSPGVGFILDINYTVKVGDKIVKNIKIKDINIDSGEMIMYFTEASSVLPGESDQKKIIECGQPMGRYTEELDKKYGKGEQLNIRDGYVVDQRMVDQDSCIEIEYRSDSSEISRITYICKDKDNNVRTIIVKNVNLKQGVITAYVPVPEELKKHEDKLNKVKGSE